MTFLSLIATLLLEQVRPLRPGNAVHTLFQRYAASLEQRLNGGKDEQGVLAWALAVLLPVLATLGISLLSYRASPALAWLWNVVVLYFTMGFRQFSHYFNEIQQSLQEGNPERAREWGFIHARQVGSEYLQRSVAQLHRSRARRQ